MKNRELVEHLRDQATVIGGGTERRLLMEAADRLESLDERIDIMETEKDAEYRPRVLTLEQLMGHEGSVLTEYNRDHVNRHPTWHQFDYMDAKTVHLWDRGVCEHYARNQYGTTWRCWTRRPTEKQSEAVSWT